MPRRARVPRRLAAFLALSALLHLGAAGLYRPGQRPLQVPPSAPAMLWVELAPLVSSPPVPARMARAGGKTVAQWRAPPPPELPPPARPVAGAAFEVRPAAPLPPAPQLGPDLFEQARRIAGETARAPAPPLAWPATEASERPILPVLDRALRRPAAGSQRHAGGLVRVVTGSGRVYCLQELPEYARGGPAELPAVATNCP